MTFSVAIGADFTKEVLPLIQSAKQSIDIVVYDWRWYADQPTHPTQRFNLELVKAVRRGVAVRAVLNTDLNVGVLNSVGIKARVTRDHRTVHAKLMIIDRKIVVLGSHNYTRNAFAGNIECSLIVDIPEGHMRVFEFFENMYSI